jgi:concanavalin A-like lectin/glucanase superfamily protein
MRLDRLRSAILLVCASLSFACGEWSGSSSNNNTAQSDPFLNLSAPAGGLDAFSTTVYPLLRQYCVACHEGAGPGSPHFANPNVSTAYQAVTTQGKVNLSNPPSSRLVVKLSSLAHNCWSNCAENGATMAAAIQAWADAVNYGSGGVSVDGALSSNSQSLGDGVIDTGGERYRGNLLALWEFKEGSGTVAHDTSGNPAPIDLTLRDQVTWMSSWGVDLEAGSLVASTAASRKLYDQIANPAAGTQQYTIEAWVTPDNIDQGADTVARIVTYSPGQGQTNFMLGQSEYRYNARTRTTSPDALDSGANGLPALQTSDADRDAQDRLQHVVVTYDQFRGRRIYVDGHFTADNDPAMPGRFWNWDPTFRLALGAEPNRGAPWKGQIRLLALYQQALTDTQIMQNYEAGVGQRLLLRFDISQWMGAGSAIEFIVTDYDSYSYLFCQPTFRSPNPNGGRIANIQIAVNGQIASSGQGFSTIDTVASGSKQELTRQCAVIPKGANGPAGDQFALVFEHLGGYQNVVVQDNVPPAPIPLDPEPRAVNGIRNFARVNASFAALTGQSPSVAQSTFTEIEQQLPPGYDVRSFVSSQQVAIAKIALDYCSAMIDGPNRAAIFPGFDFNAAPTAAFATAAQRDLVFNPLFDHMVGDNLAMQPTRAEVRAALDTMTDKLLASCASPGSCGAARTTAMVKGACAAVMSSAAVTIH